MHASFQPALAGLVFLLEVHAARAACCGVGPCAELSFCAGGVDERSCHRHHVSDRPCVWVTRKGKQKCVQGWPAGAKKSPRCPEAMEKDPRAATSNARTPSLAPSRASRLPLPRRGSGSEPSRYLPPSTASPPQFLPSQSPSPSPPWPPPPSPAPAPPSLSPPPLPPPPLPPPPLPPPPLPPPPLPPPPLPPPPLLPPPFAPPPLKPPPMSLPPFSPPPFSHPQMWLPPPRLFPPSPLPSPPLPSSSPVLPQPENPPLPALQVIPPSAVPPTAMHTLNLPPVKPRERDSPLPPAQSPSSPSSSASPPRPISPPPTTSPPPLPPPPSPLPKSPPPPPPSPPSPSPQPPPPPPMQPPSKPPQRPPPLLPPDSPPPPRPIWPPPAPPNLPPPVLSQSPPSPPRNWPPPPWSPPAQPPSPSPTPTLKMIMDFPASRQITPAKLGEHAARIGGDFFRRARSKFSDVLNKAKINPPSMPPVATTLPKAQQPAATVHGHKKIRPLTPSELVDQAAGAGRDAALHARSRFSDALLALKRRVWESSFQRLEQLFKGSQVHLFGVIAVVLIFTCCCFIWHACTHANRKRMGYELYSPDFEDSLEEHETFLGADDSADLEESVLVASGKELDGDRNRHQTGLLVWDDIALGAALSDKSKEQLPSQTRHKEHQPWVTHVKSSMRQSSDLYSERVVTQGSQNSSWDF